MEKAIGYFTIERNIVGLSLPEMESKLGLRPGELTSGARVLVLLRQPFVGEFAFAGSTLLPGAKGLVSIERRQNVPVPHAWLGQRLVKVAARLAYSGSDSHPRASSPVEQWKLLVPVDAEQVCELRGNQAYWPRR
jgi:hypothetical protein